MVKSRAAVFSKVSVRYLDSKYKQKEKDKLGKRYDFWLEGEVPLEISKII